MPATTAQTVSTTTKAVEAVVARMMDGASPAAAAEAVVNEVVAFGVRREAAVAWMMAVVAEVAGVMVADAMVGRQTDVAAEVVRVYRAAGVEVA